MCVCVCGGGVGVCVCGGGVRACVHFYSFAILMCRFESEFGLIQAGLYQK